MGAKHVAVLADSSSGGALSGRILDPGGGPGTFRDAGEMMAALERSCDRDMSPFPSSRARRFFDAQPDKRRAPRARTDTAERRRFMERMKSGDAPRGELGSFLVCVQHRENGSLQGRVTWMEENRTVCFRSAWELIQLLDEAVRGGEAPEVSWDAARADGT